MPSGEVAMELGWPPLTPSEKLPTSDGVPLIEITDTSSAALSTTSASDFGTSIAAAGLEPVGRPVTVEVTDHDELLTMLAVVSLCTPSPELATTTSEAGASTATAPGFTPTVRPLPMTWPFMESRASTVPSFPAVADGNAT